jgi:hypothetical protein
MATVSRGLLNIRENTGGRANGLPLLSVISFMGTYDVIPSLR